MDQAHREEPARHLQDATRRILRWYLRSADEAQSWVNPAEARVSIDAGADDEAPGAFASYDEAVHWFEHERANLVAAVRVASEQGMHEVAWKLAVVLRAFYMLFNSFDDWLATSEVGLRSAEAVGDRKAQAELLESLGMACTQSHDLERGEDYQRRALDLRRQADDGPGIALSLNGLGILQLRTGRMAQAQALFEEALYIYADLHDEHWTPFVQANLAEALVGLTRYEEAEQLLLAVLPIFRDRGDALTEGHIQWLLSRAHRGLGDIGRASEAAEEAVRLAIDQRNQACEGYWLIELGTVQRLSGRLADALGAFERSVLLQHRLGDWVREALALCGLAEALSASGRRDQARERAVEAIALLDGFTDPATEEIRTALRQLSLCPTEEAGCPKGDGRHGPYTHGP